MRTCQAGFQRGQTLLPSPQHMEAFQSFRRCSEVQPMPRAYSGSCCGVTFPVSDAEAGFPQLVGRPRLSVDEASAQSSQCGLLSLTGKSSLHILDAHLSPGVSFESISSNLWLFSLFTVPSEAPAFLILLRSNYYF